MQEGIYVITQNVKVLDFFNCTLKIILGTEFLLEHIDKLYNM